MAHKQFLSATRLAVPLAATLASIQFTDLQRDGDWQPALIVHFADCPFQWAINLFSLLTLERAFGADREKWLGQRIELYAHSTSIRGRESIGIRCRPLADGEGR